MVRKLILIVLRTIIVSGLLVFIGAGLIWIHPPLVILAAAGAQRGYPFCAAVDLYRGGLKRVKLAEEHEKIVKQSRMIQQDGSYELWESPEGAWWIPQGNWHALTTILAQHPSGFYALDNRVAKQGDVVLDCGAHVGTYTRQALKDGAGLVVAIEPSPKNLECLRRNLAAEIAAGRVIVVPKGVWDREDVLPLYEDPMHTAADGFVVHGSAQKTAQQVPLTTIDNLFTELRLTRVNVIKMDIKGATVQALNGARRTMRRDHPWLELATEEEEEEPEGLIKAVNDLAPGYRVRCCIPSLHANWAVRPNALVFYR